MNELFREVKRLGMQDTFKWSAIDRWPLHQGWINSVNERIAERLLEFDEKKRKNVVILFSAACAAITRCNNNSLPSVSVIQQASTVIA
jgi:protoheme ferro-lyase